MDLEEENQLVYPNNSKMNSEIKDSNEVEEQNQSNANEENIAEENKSDESPAIGSGTSNDPRTSKQTPPKGYVLRKWRRFRRDYVKYGSFSADSGLILKRRLSINDLLNSRGEQHKLKNDPGLSENDDVASVESQNVVPPLSPELGVLVDTARFSIGAESENSDERSSRVSTATSGHRSRHENIGFGRGRSRVRNVAHPRSQRARGVDHSKKYRGGKIRFEKDNSHSSVESDLRSSNSAFTRWNSLSTNGKHGNSDGAQGSEEIRSGYCKENVEAGNLSKNKLDGNCLEKENSGNGESRDLDPFVDSIALLKSTQEALENEIQQLVEIGKLSASPVGDSCDQYEENEGSSSYPLHDTYFIDLNQKIELLERELEAALTALTAKQFRALELEALLGNALQPPTKEVKTDIHFLRKNDNTLNTEFEDTLKKRMEIEVEYLILSRKAQNLKILAEDQMALLQEHKSLAEDQIRIASKLIDAESKIIMLERHAKELEASCMEFLEGEEVFKIQNRVCNISICFFVQFVLLFIALGLFIMQLLPPSSGVVPT